MDIIITGERASGKTVLAWSLLRLLEGMGHNVEYVGGSYELTRMINDEDLFPEKFEKRDIRIREIP